MNNTNTETKTHHVAMMEGRIARLKELALYVGEHLYNRGLELCRRLGPEYNIFAGKEDGDKYLEFCHKDNGDIIRLYNFEEKGSHLKSNKEEDKLDTENPPAFPSIEYAAIHLDFNEVMPLRVELMKKYNTTEYSDALAHRWEMEYRFDRAEAFLEERKRRMK